MREFSLSRRAMLGSTAALGLMGMAAPCIAPASAPTTKRVPGFQLYTVRASMATDVPGTLRAIAGIGYHEVEFAGYGDHSARQIRGLLDELGLQSPSSHMNAQLLRSDPLPLIETAIEIGHDYVTIAYLNPEDRQTIDDYKGWADTLNRVGELCRENGLRVAYHNHDFEFTSLGGQVPFDILLDETDPALVDFELDFFWVRKAGQDIVQVLSRAPNRFAMAHIKDMNEQGEMADVGTGVIDFRDILGNEAASGLRHFFVEHDQPSDPFKSAAISRPALASILD
ncbi:MAG: sugar phosphate isomerase/epimerase [Proteobacteria bacterium]|nr:sugar phosphate isomerase/epimerase [Pseudomonadota bacterium]MDA1063854.1 sugar phosphate isomerase/epimerase [Pseudomonadota bacterium]